MFYIFIENEKINGCGQCPILNEETINIEISEAIYNDYIENPKKYIWNGKDIILNPNYEKEIEQLEKERISHLTCTKRVLALALQEYGLTYTKLKQLIATNEQAQLEWDLCVELERSNPLLDIMGAELGITPKQLDNIFRLANGEVIDDSTTDKQPNTNADEVPKKNL